MSRAVCIGECMVELRPAAGGLLARGFAGDAYNTAVYLKRSAPEVEVQFLTVTGEDPLSREMRAAWAEGGVGEALAFVDARRQPGLYLIESDARGERSFHYWRGESAARGWLRALQANGGADRLAGADLVYLSGISLAILASEERPAAFELLAALRGRVGRIAFDPNVRPALWPSLTEARAAFEAAAQVADIVLPSADDLGALYGEGGPGAQMARLAALGVAEAALTVGEPGRCLVHAAGVAGWVERAPAPSVVDTSGAGDSFNGAYLAARLGGAAPEAAAAAGLALAARVVGAAGAIIPEESA